MQCSSDRNSRRRAALLAAAGALAAPAVARAGPGAPHARPRRGARQPAQRRRRSHGAAAARAQQRPHRDAGRGLGAARRRRRHADRPAHRHARHVGEQPGRRLGRGAGAGRASACPSCSRTARPPTGSSTARSGRSWRSKLEGVGLISLGWWDNGIRHITNSKRPINRPADLRGLKIRTPADPTTIDIFQALGAATQQINFSELYVALQQGVVDGQENPLANIHSAKLHEVNRFISLTGHKWECYARSSPRASPGAG